MIDGRDVVVVCWCIFLNDDFWYFFEFLWKFFVNSNGYLGSDGFRDVGEVRLWNKLIDVFVYFCRSNVFYRVFYRWIWWVLKYL